MLARGLSAGRPRATRGVRRSAFNRSARIRAQSSALTTESVPAGPHLWQVDVFENEHQGLVLAEIELGRENDLPVVMPVDESGTFYPAFGWLAGRNAHAAARLTGSANRMNPPFGCASGPPNRSRSPRSWDQAFASDLIWAAKALTLS